VSDYASCSYKLLITLLSKVDGLKLNELEIIYVARFCFLKNTDARAFEFIGSQVS
jgi:hypothetical protein